MNNNIRVSILLLTAVCFVFMSCIVSSSDLPEIEDEKDMLEYEKMMAIID